jgi:serine protease Do
VTSQEDGYLLGAIAGVGVAPPPSPAPGCACRPKRGPTSRQLIKASTAPMFAPPPGAPLSFADIFEKVSPAVVSINVTSRVEAKRRQHP